MDGVARRESESQCLDREPLKEVAKKEAPVAAAAAAMVVKFDGGGGGNSRGEWQCDGAVFSQPQVSC